MSVPIVWVLFLDQDTSLNSTTLKDSSLQVRRSKTTVNSLSDVRDIVASFLQLIFYSGLSTSKAQFQVLILDKISPSSPLHNQVSCIVCLSEANRKESRPSKSLRYFYKHMLLPKRIEVVPFNIGLTWFDDEHTSAGQQLPWIVKMATSVVDLPFLIGQHFGSRSDTSALCPQTIASPPGDKSRNTCVCYWNSASTINSVSLETAASKWRVDGMHLLLAAFGICLHEELTLRKSPAVSLTVRVHMIENKQWLTQLVKIVHDHSWNEVIERIAHESISDPEIESLNGQEVSGIQGHKLPFVHFTETKEESDKAKGSSFGVEQVKSQLWSPIRCTGSFMMIKSSGQINSEGYGGVARALPFIAQPQSSPYSGVSMTCLVDEQQLVVCLVASSTMFDEDELRVFTARSARNVSYDAKNACLKAEVQTQRGDWVMSSISLDLLITNRNGRLEWETDGGFSRSVKDVTVVGGLLTCIAQSASGAHVKSTLDLDKRIANVDGCLVYQPMRHN